MGEMLFHILLAFRTFSEVVFSRANHMPCKSVIFEVYLYVDSCYGLEYCWLILYSHVLAVYVSIPAACSEEWTWNLEKNVSPRSWTLSASRAHGASSGSVIFRQLLAEGLGKRYSRALGRAVLWIIMCGLLFVLIEAIKQDDPSSNGTLMLGTWFLF